MNVRVKPECGNYGLVVNGTIKPKNYASGAFFVDDAKGAELVRRGIVCEVVGNGASGVHRAATAPPAVVAATCGGSADAEGVSADYAAMTLKELRALGKARDIPGCARMNKAALVDALESADAAGGESPAFDASKSIA